MSRSFTGLRYLQLGFTTFGTSRHLEVAVSFIIATMSLATISLIAMPDTPEFFLVMTTLAVLAGLISILPNTTTLASR